MGGRCRATVFDDSSSYVPQESRVPLMELGVDEKVLEALERIDRKLHSPGARAEMVGRAASA